MTRTRPTNKRRRRHVIPVNLELKPSFFEGVLNEVTTRIYGRGGYSFESTAKQALKETADSFIQNMWTKVKQIAADNDKLEIDKASVEEWKRVTGFKLRRKFSSISLCDLMADIKNQNPKKYIYTPRII